MKDARTGGRHTQAGNGKAKDREYRCEKQPKRSSHLDLP
jgi:hypothetical protein